MAVKPATLLTAATVAIGLASMGFLWAEAQSPGSNMGYAIKRLAASPAVKTTVVASGLKNPWGLAFLPNGDMLITERNGGLRIVQNGVLNPTTFTGMPPALQSGQGGYLDIEIDPNFATNSRIYFCYATGTAGSNATRLARATLGANSVSNVQVLFTQTPNRSWDGHFGCRIVFHPDGKLYLSLGEGGQKEQAQLLNNHLGKIVRLNLDGTVPSDNPYVGRAGALPEIYAYGIRSPQGMVLRPNTTQIWENEHGARGGDEVNLIKPGANYGWPAITHGIDYSGALISDKTALPGMEQPLVYWVPSIAPSGMTFYTGDKFPHWRGDAFVGALAGAHVRRLDVEGDRIVGQEVITGAGLNTRIRTVKEGPDGNLYVLTDANPGNLIRIEPN